VRDLIARRLHNDESGVTMVIVALCLIALVGMLVLVVDVGGLLWNRRAMVNASDAAALAAAKSCVLPTGTGVGTDTYPAGIAGAEQAADDYAHQNSSGADTSAPNIISSNGCDSSASGYVTVEYGANQQLFFAGIFGKGQGHVTTQATAIWGPAGEANPLPLVVYSNMFQDCKLDTESDPNTVCHIWEDNNNTDGSQNGFGFLDLRKDPGSPRQYGWDTQNPSATCANAGSDIKGWIDNYPDPGVGDLPVHFPNPTFVCLASGGKSSAFGNDNKKDGPLYDLIDDDDSVDHNDQEDILFFPLNRCDQNIPATFGQVDKSGNFVPCSQTPNQYDIVGFVALKLINIYTPNEAQGGGGTCTSDVTISQGANETVPFPITGLSANGGSACPTTMPDAVGPGPTIVKVHSSGPNGPGPDPVQCSTAPLSVPASCDYFYSNGTITWYRSGPATEGQDFRISFGWQTAGPCGVPPAGNTNNAGHCLAVKIVKVQVGGGGAGEGDPSSNLRAVKLCDPNYAGSCAPLSVPKP